MELVVVGLEERGPAGVQLLLWLANPNPTLGTRNKPFSLPLCTVLYLNFTADLAAAFHSPALAEVHKPPRSTVVTIEASKSAF